MSKPYTHILEQYPESVDPTQRGPRGEQAIRPSQSILYRADTGLTIAARQGQIVSLGDDSKTAVVRTYRDDKYAEAALKAFADHDRQLTHGTAGAVIEEIDMSHRVIHPSLGDITSITNGRKQ